MRTVTVTTPPDTIAPSKASLSSALPSSTTENSISIEVNGEAEATVWVNGVQKGTIDENGKLTLTLDTSGTDGTKNFSIILKDADNNASEELSVSIEKTTAQTPDTTKPVITLLGNPTITLIAGESYHDAGAMANDNKDGDISAEIQTTNPVDSNKIGTYSISYNVKDLAGNKANQVVRNSQCCSYSQCCSKYYWFT